MTQAEVMPTLRKFPQHSLWYYQVSKWTPEQIKEFKELRDGIITKEVIIKNKKPSFNAVKIIRVSDGFIYNSITECKNLEGFHDVEIREKIKLGIEFKRI